MANTEFWKSLSDKHRALIEAAATKAENDVRDRMASIEAEAYAAAKENGMQIYTPTAEELAEWRKALGEEMLKAAETF